MLPIVPLVWGARAAGHEVLLATTADMTDVAAQAGLPAVDVFPDFDVWDDLMRLVTRHGTDNDPAEIAAADGLSEELVRAAQSGHPFTLFTLTMTEGTIATGRDFGADLVVHTSDHAAGRLAATALDTAALEMGNRVSWWMRDADFHENHTIFGEDDLVRGLREKLGSAESDPTPLARIDPRAPSMGGGGCASPWARSCRISMAPATCPWSSRRSAEWTWR